MPLVLSRVDNRLVHGQVLEGWVPRYSVELIIVADEDLYGDSFQKSILEAMGQGVIEIQVTKPTELAALVKANELKPTAILFKTVKSVIESIEAGFELKTLNLGNIHPSENSRPLTDSVYINDECELLLRKIIAGGVKVEARAVPGEPGKDVAKLLNVGADA